ncbi:MAG: NFACT family protein [Clostridia bacterium]|nr:NFACT family protein [Clostridia bacterium]
MAFDGITTKKIVSELNTALGDGKINKIYEPNKNEIILGVYAKGINFALNLSIASDSYRINLTTHQKANPLNAPGFCMLLRKHITGAKIKKIYTIGLERIVYIDLECLDELNDLINKKLIIELMGKHSNIILTNENGFIIDSLRHLSKDDNSSRDILPARAYETPENSKINFDEIKTFDEFYKLIPDDKKIDCGIASTFTGISRLLIQSIIEKNNLTTEKNSSSLKIIFKELQEMLKNIDTDKVITESYSNDFVLYLANNSEGNISQNITDNLQSNFFIDDYYFNKETDNLFNSYKNNLLKLVLSTLSKIKKKLVNINQKIEDCKNMDMYKLYGELITANMYLFPEYNSDKITVQNYYNNNEEIEIPVDKNKTPSVNAKNYYKKYNKLKNALSIVNEQKAETIQELDYLESIIYEIDMAKNISDIDEIYSELTENTLFERTHLKSNAKITKKQNRNKKANKEYTPIEYKIENFTLLVGKNNVQNDYLTTKLARSNDIWFHTKDIHGSHAILITKGETPSMDVLIRCAQIAAYYSKAKMSSNVPVDYTLVKYVKKPSGAKPGFVIYTHNKTINVTPKN